MGLLGSILETLFCNGRAEKAEDQAHDVIIRIAEFKNVKFSNLTKSMMQSQGPNWKKK